MLIFISHNLNLVMNNLLVLSKFFILIFKLSVKDEGMLYWNLNIEERWKWV